MKHLLMAQLVAMMALGAMDASSEASEKESKPYVPPEPKPPKDYWVNTSTTPEIIAHNKLVEERRRLKQLSKMK